MPRVSQSCPEKEKRQKERQEPSGAKGVTHQSFMEKEGVVRNEAPGTMSPLCS